MYLCVCKAVSDRRVSALARAGVCSLRELSKQTGLGTGCGKCVPAAQQLIAETLLRGEGSDAYENRTQKQSNN